MNDVCQKDVRGHPFVFLASSFPLASLVATLRGEKARVIRVADVESLLSLVVGGFSCHRGGFCVGVAPGGVIIDSVFPGGVKAGRELLRRIPGASVAILTDRELHPADLELGMLAVPKTGASWSLLTGWVRAIVVHEQVEAAIEGST